MAKPAAIQKLKHGKALCGATFGRFVDSWNWMVDFCTSLQGDKDANNANGTITVDRANPSAPVIRADKPKDGGEGISGIDVVVNNTTYSKVKQLTLQSGNDSDVRFTVPGTYDESTGNLTLKIDVYYA